MAANNLIIHTGDYFNLTDIHYVLIAYIEDPTWSSVSDFKVTNYRSLINVESDNKINKWVYNTDIEKDISFKFNVIALFKENSKDKFDSDGNLIEGEPVEKSLLAFGNYDATQLVSISEDWTINISANWVFRDGGIDFSTDFEVLYNKHTINTNPTSGLYKIHDRLVDSNATPTNNLINSKVASYQNRAVKNITNSNEINGIYGVNIIRYDFTNKKLLESSEFKSDDSVQTLVVNRLGGGYEDVISIYEHSNMNNLKADYITNRLTKDNYK